MLIDDIALCEFRDLYEAEFEERLSTQEVGEMAHRVLALYEQLAVLSEEECADQRGGQSAE